ncbi:MAG: heme-copper oxidase subunit III [Bacteroidia bacterium]
MEAAASERPIAARKRQKLHPKEFLMWAFLVSVFMIFAGFTSGYIVRRADGNWLEFVLPSGFMMSTILVVLSSVSMQWSLNQARKDQLERVKLGLVFTVLLGVGFIAAQFNAFGQMVEMGLFLVGNPSSSFLYIITGVHALHLMSAIIVLFVIFANVFRYKVHSKNLMGIRLGSIYWHFLGALWIYLYVFFLIMN